MNTSFCRKKGIQPRVHSEQSWKLKKIQSKSKFSVEQLISFMQTMSKEDHYWTHSSVHRLHWRTLKKISGVWSSKRSANSSWCSTQQLILQLLVHSTRRIVITVRTIGLVLRMNLFVLDHSILLVWRLTRRQIHCSPSLNWKFKKLAEIFWMLNSMKNSFWSTGSGIGNIWEMCIGHSAFWESGFFYLFNTNQISIYRARQLSTPTIVQCIDGCSKSGTLVSIETALMHFIRGSPITKSLILQSCVFVRLQRRLSVSSVLLYLFIYRVILRWIEPYVNKWYHRAALGLRFKSIGFIQKYNAMIQEFSRITPAY